MYVMQEQYPVDTALPQNDGPTLTSVHSTAGLRWLFDRRERWGVTMDELGTLLGGVSRRTVTGWQTKVNGGETVEVSRDVMDRISLLLGIHKALTLITPSGHESMANDWFQKPIDLMGLQGKSIKAYLLEQGSMEALYYIRRNLDAMRG